MSDPRTLSNRTIGVAAAVVMLAGVLVTFSGAFRTPFQAPSHVITANFERTPQLRTGSQVRIQGNVEGKVLSIDSAPDRRSASVRMRVNKSAGEIYANAHARLGFKTLLGGVFYVELDRGTSASGRLGDSAIPLRNTSVQAELEDVTDTLRAGAVTGLQTLPGELANALADPTAPTDALNQLTAVAPDTTTALTALRGTDPGADLPDVVDATARTVKALDTPRKDIQTLVSGAAQTLAVTGRRSDEIRATLDAGPPVTSDLTHTLARLDRTLGLARGLVRRLRPAAPQVAPTLAALRPTLGSTSKLLVNAKPLTRTLPGTLNTLATASRQLSPTVEELKPAIAKLDTTILPYLAAKSPETGKSTTLMVGGWAANFGFAAGQQDQNGHFIRFPASISADSLYLPCRSSLIQGNAKAVLECDSVNDALRNYLKYFSAGTSGGQGGNGR